MGVSQTSSRPSLPMACGQSSSRHWRSGRRWGASAAAAKASSGGPSWRVSCSDPQPVVGQEALKPAQLFGQQGQPGPFGPHGGGQQMQLVRQRLPALLQQGIQRFGHHLRAHAGDGQQDAAGFISRSGGVNIRGVGRHR